MDLTQLESRASDNFAAYKDFVNPLIESGQALSDEQRSRKDELKAASELAQANLAEARKIAEHETAVVEARAKSPLNVVMDVAVTNEPRAHYGRDSRHSWFADMTFAKIQGSPQQGAAQQRLSEHGAQVEQILAKDGKEARAIEHLVMTESRSNPDQGERRLAEMRQRGASVEQRTGVTTASGSGGAWVPPVYLLDDTVFYAQAGRAFLDAIGSEDLPSTGLQILVPVVASPAGVAVHNTQNSAVTETDLTSSNITIAVQAVAGQMIVSVEEMERQAYGGGFDSIVFKQLMMAYNVIADGIALANAVAGATALAYTGTFALTVANSAGGFYEKVNGAAALIRSTAGVFRNPNALFLQPTRWGWMASFADGSGRPLIVPNSAGPMNAAAGGSNGNVPVQGPVGYQMCGLSVYQDANIPVPGTGADQALVLDTTAILAMESGPTPLVFPQTLANQMSVLLQLRGYIATAPLLPGAVVAVSGSAMGAISF